MRFSVIIPLYNKAPYVRKALESVLDQTFRDFELIVVDDGSTDESLSVAQLVLKDTQVQHIILHQSNAGVSTARNNGVAVSNGDYLCFLDADDWWAPTFLEKMDGLLWDYPDAGIYGVNYYYVKNGIERVCVKDAKTGYINYCRVYFEGMVMPLTSISVCIPRSVFERFCGFKPHLIFGEDFDLWIRIALKEKVAFLNEPLAYYNQDVDPTWRGIGHLVNPRVHMLWNLDDLSSVEESNADYKLLIDRLRIRSLFRYYLSTTYRDDAKRELAKVEWCNQSTKDRVLYKMPVFILRIRQHFLKLGSVVKQWLIKHL